MRAKRISEGPSSSRPALPRSETAETGRGTGWLQAGLEREKAGWIEGAADAYLTVLLWESRQGQALLGLGRVYFALGEVAQASLFLEALLLSEPGHPEGRLLLGLVRYRQGQDLAAIRLLARQERPTELRLDQPEARECLGECHYRRGNYLNAILTWLPLLEEARCPERILLSLGAALFHLGRYQGAYAFFRQAVAENPESAGALNNAAVACYELGDRAQARRWLEQSLLCDPALVEARENLRLLTPETLLRRAAGGKDRP
jgi:tetratricopeptide (TPR) repeat protein